MKIATWNVNSLAVRLPQLLDWLQAEQPAVVALQETKLVDSKFPHDALAQAGWKAACFGQPKYNGVALLSRNAATDAVRNIPGFDDPLARVITATVDGLRVVCAYFPNGQAPDSDKFAYKMRWLDALAAWLRAELVRHPDLVLLGDFNIAPEDRDVFDPEGLRGTIHCTDAERAHFRALLELGLVDAFRQFEQPPKTWSWWDYRNLAFRRNQGLRIDHVLVGRALLPRLRGCRVDKAPRRNERPSDHAPVVAELEWAPR